ncbi:hypothetical protein ACFY2Z_31050 [Streptomyces sp. NPDC001222]|uniref:hypothetical protein n=1 Tax=Streptomyces sp. NPDC001222 TaxID=3364548 RepID=UPI0036786047
MPLLLGPMASHRSADPTTPPPQRHVSRNRLNQSWGTLSRTCGTPGGMKLSDLSPLMARREDGGLGYDRFRADPALASLHWPDDVLEQFLFDHGDNGAFVSDYDSIDLLEVKWQLETIPATDFIGMPTGASDAGCIESYAEKPVYWVEVRRPEVGRHWEEHGTWLRRRS